MSLATSIFDETIDAASAPPTPVQRISRAPQSTAGFVLLIAMIAVVAMGKMVLHDTLDPDLFQHIRIAESIARQPFPGPLVDDLSFASVRTPWTPYAWLAELGMMWTWDHGGVRAIVGIQLLTCGAFVVFLALSAHEMTIAAFGQPRHLAAAVATFVGIFIALPYLSFRPVSFTLMFLAAAAWILCRDRRLGERSAAVWCLPLLVALLINFHFFAVLLPTYCFLLTIGALWESRFPGLLADTTNAAERSRRLRRCVTLTAATSLACVATPMFAGMVKVVLHYQFADVMVSSNAIAEMVPFYKASPLAPVAAAFVVALLALSIIYRNRLRAADWTWIAFSLFLILRLGRFSPVFAIFAAPIIAVVLPRLSDQILSRKLALGLLAAALLINIARIAPALPTSHTTLDQWLNRLKGEEGYPTAAAGFVRARVRPVTHHIITEFTWGAFLEWRLGDEYQMLLDGRVQLFTAEFWRKTYLNGEGPERLAFLRSVGADAAILPAAHSVFRNDLLKLGWSQAFADDDAIVLLPPSDRR